VGKTKVRNKKVAERTMKLWDYLLTADRTLDLADEQRAVDWLASQKWHLPVSTVKDLDGWQESLLALRFIAAGRYPRRRFRPAEGMDAKKAMDTLHDHLRRMIIWPDKVQGEPLKGYAGLADPDCRLKIFPSYASPDRIGAPVIASAELALDAPNPDVWQGGNLFWQLAFLGLFNPDSQGGAVVCKTCGEQLPSLTPTGKPSKQQECGACRIERWKAKKTKKELRETYRRHYLTRAKKGRKR
jgi:hypothetical protein